MSLPGPELGPRREESDELPSTAASIPRAIARGEPLSRTLERIVRSIESVTSGLKAAIMLCEGDRLRFGAGPSLPDGYKNVVDGVVIGEGIGSCGTAAHRRAQVVVDDTQADPTWQNYREIARRYGLRACWSTPILGVDGELLGTFGVYSSEPRKPQPIELRLVQEHAALAAIAIDRQRLADALRDSERRFDDLVDDLDAVVWEAEDGRITRVSPRAEAMLGYPIERWLSSPDFLDSIVHDEDREVTVRRRREALAASRRRAYEYRLRAADGRVVWVREIVDEQRDAGKRAPRSRGVMLNVTREREASHAQQERLQGALEEEDLLRGILRQMPEGVFLVSPSSRIVLANAQAERILGCTVETSEAFEAHPWWQTFRHDGRPYTLDEWPPSRALRGEAVVGEAMDLVRRDGTIASLTMSAAPVRRDGAVVAAVAVLADVSARKRIELARRLVGDASAKLVASLDAESNARAVAELSVRDLADFCIVLCRADDGSTRCIAADIRDRAKAALLADLERLLPQPGGAPFRSMQTLSDGRTRLFPKVSADAFDPGAVRLETMRIVQALGTISAMTVAMQTRNRVVGAVVFGSCRADRVYGPPEASAAEELCRIAAMALENARLYQEAQAAVQQRERFLSIAAHELNTPLSALVLTLRRLSRQLDEGLVDVKWLGDRARTAERQSARLAMLVGELLDVSRIQADRVRLSLENTDLVEAVHAVVDRFSDEAAARRVDVAVHAAAPVVGVWDRLRLELVITNLLSNALKYGGDGRPIRIAVQADEETARLSVEDEGIGMSAELVARLFRPFERGVPTGQYAGLGLGLFIAEQIVRAHGGEMHVRSAPGKGSTFIVELPRAPR